MTRGTDFLCFWVPRDRFSVFRGTKGVDFEARGSILRSRGAPERPGSSQGVREAPQGEKKRFVAHPRGPKRSPFWLFFDPKIDEILVKKPVAKKSVSGSSFCEFWVPKGGPTPPKCCVY